MQNVPAWESYRGLVHQQINRCLSKLPPSSVLDREDLVSEAWLLYDRARAAFDPDRGPRFITYYYWVLVNGLGRIVRREFRGAAFQASNAPVDCGEDDPLDTLPDERPGYRGIADCLPHRLSRAAYALAREIVSPSGSYRDWEAAHYSNRARSPRLILQRCLRWFGWDKEKRWRVRQELRTALLADAPGCA